VGGQYLKTGYARISTGAAPVRRTQKGDSMNSKMKAVKRKHRKSKDRWRALAAESRKNAKAKTRELWQRTGLIPAFRT